MTEHVLPYDRSIVPQETGWDCGPASTQVVLNSLGVIVSERDLIAEIGTTVNGTDDVSWIETRALDRRIPQAKYTTVYMRDDPPNNATRAALWANIVGSINAGYGVVMNWVAPPSNAPRGVKGSPSPAGYGKHTIYHYVACMGYDDTPGGRAVWIADSGFSPFGYWIGFDQCASLIPPKGYCYAAVGVPVQPAPISLRDRHALDILAEGRRRGITARGQTIALATALVESNITIYANAKVPASMALPHEAVGYDGFSVGIFQQQVVWGANGWWWGDAATCMDPTLSAGLFYERLARLNYQDITRSPGSFAQAVQSSAYPDRYDQRWGDAEDLYRRLATITPADPVEELLMSDLRVPSLSIYATPGEPDIPVVELIRAVDAKEHRDLVDDDARRGDPDALTRVARTAAGKGIYGNAAGPVNHARAVLADIERDNPEYLTRYINQKGA